MPLCPFFFFVVLCPPSDFLFSFLLSVVVSRFGEDYRPVQLNIVVEGFHASRAKSEFIFENNLNYRLFDIIRTHSNGKPALVVCCVVG